MKFLIAFAVIAVAFATEEVRVAHLPPAPAHLPPAPAPAFEAHYPLIASASLLEALNVPMNVLRADETPVEEALPVMVREIQSEGTQNDGLKVLVFDGPNDAVDAPFEQLEPVKVAEILMAEVSENIESLAQPEVNMGAPVEPVKVAVIETEVPLHRVKIVDPYIMLPRYEGPENIDSLAQPEVSMGDPVEPVKVAVIETEVPLHRVKIVDPYTILPRYESPENIDSLAQPEVSMGAPVEPVKVAVIETEVPLHRVKIVDPYTMLPRYEDPALR